MRAVNDSSRSLFDPDKARQPRRGPDVGASRPDKRAAAGMSVSALLARIKNALAESFPKSITVIGELSNCSLAASGHFYFTLKDANAAIPAVMWRRGASKLRFRPEDGMEVVLTGRVDVYDAQGKLQLYADSITLKGAGELELAFRQLKEKLQGEGLFDPARKKPLPRIPRAIGVVSSPTGAAIRDIGRTLRRRWPAATVYLLAAPVQGEGAAEKIAAAIAAVDRNARRLQIDVILVARGGGSLEDLWAFNEEPVARAIAAARTPVITGVGHEVDITIADLAADVRAATPTAAAERAAPDRAEMGHRIDQLAARLSGLAIALLADARRDLQSAQRSVVFRDPTWRLRSAAQRLDELALRLPGGLKDCLARARRRLEPAGNRLAALHPARLAERARGRLDRLTSRLAWVLGARSKRAGDRLADLCRRLEAHHPRHRLALARQAVAAALRQLGGLSYRATLTRGFSVTRDADGKILRFAAQTATGDRIATELVDGQIESVVSAGPDRPDRQRPKRRQRPAGGATLFDADAAP